MPQPDLLAHSQRRDRVVYSPADMQIASRTLQVIGLLCTVASTVFAQAQPASRPGTAVITGQLKTVDGKIADDVRVSALAAPPPNVRPEDGIQYYIAPPPIRTVMTDKDGRYRITNLAPGR